MYACIREIEAKHPLIIATVLFASLRRRSWRLLAAAGLVVFYFLMGRVAAGPRS
jgi:hypothetical protein